MQKAIPLSVTNLINDLVDVINEKSLNVDFVFNDLPFHITYKYFDQNFYFKIIQHTPTSNNDLVYHFHFYPSNKVSFKSHMKNTGNEASLVYAFNSWVDIITQYDTVEHKYIDQDYLFFVEGIYQRIGGDKATSLAKPLPQQSQIELVNRLDNIVRFLEESSNPEISQSKVKIIERCNQLKENIKTTTQENVIKVFAGIWSYLKRASPEIFHGALGNAVFELVKLLT